MKLTKAIEIQTFEDNATLPPRNGDFWDAVRLGKEALKTIKQERTIYGFKRLGQLPGETPE